jgi:hypothetical protein
MSSKKLHLPNVSQSILDIVLDIIVELEQLESWVCGKQPVKRVAVEVNTETCQLDTTRRRVKFLCDIYGSINTEDMRTMACSDEFWTSSECRQSVLQGILHTAVYLRENLMHLVDRIVIKQC